MSIRSVLSQYRPRNECMYAPGDFAGLSARIGREIEERHANGRNDGRCVHPVQECALVGEQHLRLHCTPRQWWVRNTEQPPFRKLVRTNTHFFAFRCDDHRYFFVAQAKNNIRGNPHTSNRYCNGLFSSLWRCPSTCCCAATSISSTRAIVSCGLGQQCSCRCGQLVRGRCRLVVLHSRAVRWMHIKVVFRNDLPKPHACSSTSWPAAMAP